MRPPHYTGENLLSGHRTCGWRSFNEAPALHGGKRRDWYGNQVRRPPASMRPPHYTGENANGRELPRLEQFASMRPPHYTGENKARMENTNSICSFNEAPALHGGKPQRVLDVGRRVGGASMRPPHYTGENWKCSAVSAEGMICFNEAPALHGGKRRRA